MDDQRVDPGQSALAAWREDVAAVEDQSALAGQFLTIATLVRQAAIESKSSEAERQLAQARDLSADVIRAAHMSLDCELDLPGFESPLDIFRRTTEVMMDHLLASLKGNLFDSLVRLAPRGSLLDGRLELERIRAQLFLSRFDVALSNLSAFEESKWFEVPELRLKAWHHRGQIERYRGNLAESERWFSRMLEEVGEDHRGLRARAHWSFGVARGQREDWNTAIRHIWQCHLLSRGTAWRMEYTSISDLAILLMNAGYIVEARSVLRGLLSTRHPLILYSVLGCYAEASGKLGDRDGVVWSTSQVLELTTRQFHARAAAQTLFDCSLALKAVNDPDRRADPIMQRSLQIARRYGFHDLLFRAEQEKRLPAKRSALDRSSESIIAELTAGVPAELPATLAYAE